MSRLVLACNAGSSSLKLALYRVQAGSSATRAERLSRDGFEGDAGALTQSLQQFLDSQDPIDHFLHRIVHAGAVPESLQPLDAALQARIRHWSPLAPSHNPLSLRLIDGIARRWPQARQFAAFDSGLYADLPAVARCYALPAQLSPGWPLQRYGFHGLAHRSQWRQVQQLCEQHGLKPARRLISLHLGSGCSATAWLDGRAVDTSMGFTPLEGLVMAKRAGSLDPGILLHLLRNEQKSPAELDTLLRQSSGLGGLSGGLSDMRKLIVAGGEQAEAAIAHYCYQLRKQIGAFAAALGGIDAISFGGGVGENQPAIRARALAGLEDFGIELDAAVNAQAGGSTLLQSRRGRVLIALAPVDEMDEMLRQYQQSI